MRLRRLVVRRMPGFEDEGFPLNDLSGGLNVVLGPNGSGKTTACRAIRGLLWPETLAGVSPASLAGGVGRRWTQPPPGTGGRAACASARACPPIPAAAGGPGQLLHRHPRRPLRRQPDQRGPGRQVRREEWPGAMTCGRSASRIPQIRQPYGQSELPGVRAAKAEVQNIEREQEGLRSRLSLMMELMGVNDRSNFPWTMPTDRSAKSRRSSIDELPS